MIRYLFLAVVLISNNPLEIAKINKMKKEAERAYLNGEYDLALAKYNWLTDSMSVEDPEVLLNKAHCYYHLEDSAAAKSNYRAVAANGTSELKSVAYQQLGVMAKSPSTLQESLQFMKAAVKENPSNMDARYDYEVVKKLIEKQEESENQDQEQNQQDQQEQEEEQDQQEQENQDQQQSEDENGEENNEEQQEQEPQESDQEQEGEEQEQQEQEGQESEEEQQQQQQQDIRDKLEEMNISEEKARMILEAMRNNEIQYIQQQRRKATERPDSGKPDW